jgi:hypothetical protein
LIDPLKLPEIWLRSKWKHPIAQRTNTLFALCMQANKAALTSDGSFYNKQMHLHNAC